MAITSGPLNPHLATLTRPQPEPGKPQGKVPEGAKGGPPVSKEGSKPLAGQQKAAPASTPAATPASASAEAEAAVGEELGLMKQDLDDLQSGGKAPADTALYDQTLQDGFATKQVVAARPVQQVSAVTDSRFQGRAAAHQDAVSLEKMGAPVKARSESATPEDLALLDMSEEHLGEKIDLTKVTES